MAQIKLKRGPTSNIQALALEHGEPALAGDKYFYIGTSDGGKVLINPDIGAAESADQLTNSRNFSISGDATAPAVAFNGTQNVGLVLVLANSGVAEGTYTKLTVNAKGLVTSATTLIASDIPTLTLSKISDAGTAASKNTGIASGNVPVLDTNGKLANSVLPAIAITDTFVVASQAAMLALSSAEVGDIAIRTDVNKSFILKTAGYNTLANWQELLTPTDTVLSVNGKTGAVSLAAADVGAEPTIPAGASTQYWNGLKAFADFATSVRAATLTGMVTTSSAAVVATDNVVVAIGKLQSQVSLRLTADSVIDGGTF